MRYIDKINKLNKQGKWFLDITSLDGKWQIYSQSANSLLSLSYLPQRKPIKGRTLKEAVNNAIAYLDQIRHIQERP